MTLRPGEEQGRGIAVFPFLKTSGTIQLGNFVFRSTDDTSGLECEDASHVRDIAEMLFPKDHLRNSFRVVRHVTLAVGFETLLGLPRDGKTDRFIDAISLLLGRVPRLNAWAVQFYAARSDVAHEGLTERLRLMPTVQKPNEQGPEYQSLMSYGRQILQLCVGTVLFGAHLAERSELHEKLTTNQERLELICKALSDGGLSPIERFTAIDDIVAAVEQYRYVIETDLKIDTMTRTLGTAAKNLLECQPPGDPPITTALNDIVTAKKTKEGFEVLVAIEAWYSVMPKGPLEPKSPTGITRRLTEIVWHYNFMRYFQMNREREATASAAPPPPSTSAS